VAALPSGARPPADAVRAAAAGALATSVGAPSGIVRPAEPSTPPLEEGDSPANPVAKPGYTLDFQEEFSGTELNTDQWLEYYLPQWTDDREKAKAQYTVENGVLHEYLTPETQSWSPLDTTVKISSIQTYNQKHWHKFASSATPYRDEPVFDGYTTKYGYFEMRAKKSDVLGGGHQAWWMVGVDDTSIASANPEIDIVETFFRYPDSWAIEGYGWGSADFFSNWNGTGWEGKTVPHGSPTQEFHTYAMEWTPTELLFYYDNELFYRLDDAPNQEMGMILGIYTDAGSGTHNDTWPKGWDVDYIRVYKNNDGYAGTVAVEGAGQLSPGVPNPVTTVVTNWSAEPLVNADVQLVDLPDGWTATLATPAANLFQVVAPNTSVRTKWLVTPPIEVAGEPFEFRAEATYTLDCPPITVAATVAGRVLTDQMLPASGMTATTDSEHLPTGGEGPAANVLDGNPATIWHTKYRTDSGYSNAWPHWVRLDLGGEATVSGLRYLGRQSGANGRINAYRIEVSENGSDWTQVAAGSFANNGDWQTQTFTETKTRYVRLVATSNHGGFLTEDKTYKYSSAAEIQIMGELSEPAVGHPPAPRPAESECAAAAHLRIGAIEGLAPGKVARVATILKNLGTDPLVDVDVQLSGLPATWAVRVAEPAGNLFAEVAPGAVATTDWLVSAPVDASSAGAAPLAEARWLANCVEGLAEARAAWQVGPGEVIPAAELTATSDSAQSGYGPERVLDGSPSTEWHSLWTSSAGYHDFPIWLQLTLAQPKAVDGLIYRGREEGLGRSKAYRVDVALGEEDTWVRVAAGEFANTAAAQSVAFPPVEVDRVRLVILSDHEPQDADFASAGEVRLTSPGAQEAYGGHEPGARETTTPKACVPPELSLSVTVSGRCVAGRAYLAVRVVNTDEVAATVELSSPFGGKVFASVAPGKTAAHAFSTRLAAPPAGTVVVDAVGLAPPAGAEPGGLAPRAHLTESYEVARCG
jgi:hypothetical protein